MVDELYERYAQPARRLFPHGARFLPAIWEASQYEHGILFKADCLCSRASTKSIGKIGR